MWRTSPFDLLLILLLMFTKVDCHILYNKCNLDLDIGLIILFNSRRFIIVSMDREAASSYGKYVRGT